MRREQRLETLAQTRVPGAFAVQVGGPFLADPFEGGMEQGFFAR